MSTSNYVAAGVREQEEAISSVQRHLLPTFSLPADTEILTELGHYAAVIKLSSDLALAISTDGVGSKTIVASALNKYDTIGFDCVAMNVNDVICVGARPIAMVDYLGVNTLDSLMADSLLRGLAAAAHEAQIAIPGGEIAQLPEVIGSDGMSPGDTKSFDLVGTCIGSIHPDKLILGAQISAGNGLIGIKSSGVHSNGLTLARRIFLDKAGYRYDDVIPEFGKTLGEELLSPTAIYVRAVTSLWDEGIETTGLAHITSDGFANLLRLNEKLHFRIHTLPQVPPVFSLIQEIGAVPNEEMFRVFNMGIGFVIATQKKDIDRATALLTKAGYEATLIGEVAEDPRGIVSIEERQLELTRP